ncbi:MAG TPA: aldehyde dehydrogenase [Thermodesulfobacteriota bacterium]|nr:aldehyde dehydrogenase [Thermodesulfobacteriota bacterium]
MMKAVVERQREYFGTGKTLPLGFRIGQLKTLKDSIERNEKIILEALYKDLRKSEIEAYNSEVLVVAADIDYVLKRIKKWVRPRKVRTPLIHLPAKSLIYPEPAGVILILSPWNYPFQLTFVPLIGAIAAGNCAVLKPSEYAPHTSAAMAEIIRDNFEQDYITVAEGGVDVSQALLQEKFDHIFFTGSTDVGKRVMRAASEHLTPVTLELGGKSPSVVWKDANIEVASRRILWGKFLNAGQTCVAPDYLLVHQDISQRFVEALIDGLRKFYGPSPQQSKDYGRIVNERHFERLRKYLEDGTVLFGGEHDKKDLYIAPTLLSNIKESSTVMQDEIFGPILPVIEFKTIKEVVDRINSKPKPLSLYLFTEDQSVQDVILKNISSGGVCINDTVSHIVGSDLPFGGVGDSGFGSYHGKASFDSLTHYKSVLRRRFSFDSKMKYPPYRVELKKIKKILKFLLR